MCLNKRKIHRELPRHLDKSKIHRELPRNLDKRKIHRELPRHLGKKRLGFGRTDRCTGNHSKGPFWRTCLLGLFCGPV